MNDTANRMWRLFRRIAIGISLSALLLATAGCLTQQQVKQIVDDSNTRMLASQFPEAQLTARAGAADGDDVAKRIEDFIAAHPDQKTLNGALRVRQAIFYLNRRQWNLAEAAFAAAGELGVVTARDEALVAVHKEFVWWHEVSAAGKFQNDKEVDRAGPARQKFNDEARKRASSPETRDFLAEVGAWIGLAHAASAKSGEVLSIMEQTIDGYAFILDAADIDWLCHPQAIPAKADMQTVRRRVRTEEVLNSAADLTTKLSIRERVKFGNDKLQDLIAPTAATAVCDRRFPRKP